MSFLSGNTKRTRRRLSPEEFARARERVLEEVKKALDRKSRRNFSPVFREEQDRQPAQPEDWKYLIVEQQRSRKKKSKRGGNMSLFASKEGSAAVKPPEDPKSGDSPKEELYKTLSEALRKAIDEHERLRGALKKEMDALASDVFRLLSRGRLLSVFHRQKFLEIRDNLDQVNFILRTIRPAGTDGAKE